jgi:hypothetical protein
MMAVTSPGPASKPTTVILPLAIPLFLIGPAFKVGGNVVSGRVEHVEAETGDDRTSVGVDLEDQHLATGLAGDHRDEQPVGTATDHEDPFALGELTASDVVNGHCRGFHESCVPQRDLVRQPDEDA